MNNQTDSLRAPRRSRQGMTLIELLVGAVILGILALMASTAFFYPRLLVVNSGLEQSAIHAGIAEIEMHLYDTNFVSLGTFNTDGRVPIDIDTTITETNDVDSGGNPGKYAEIKTTVEYRDGKTVDLITYRSLEVPSNQR